MNSRLFRSGNASERKKDIEIIGIEHSFKLIHLIKSGYFEGLTAALNSFVYDFKKGPSGSIIK